MAGDAPGTRPARPTTNHGRNPQGDRPRSGGLRHIAGAAVMRHPRYPSDTTDATGLWPNRCCRRRPATRLAVACRRSTPVAKSSTRSDTSSTASLKPAPEPARNSASTASLPPSPATSMKACPSPRLCAASCTATTDTSATTPPPSSSSGTAPSPSAPP
ncbi:autotransporter-associated beta strand repeat-containing protein [Streptomyces sp. KO7888]|nr:autotransporter-associated beta strand repeat-containing protein [Streptomyces sp. KO7888]